MASRSHAARAARKTAMVQLAKRSLNEDEGFELLAHVRTEFGAFTERLEVDLRKASRSRPKKLERAVLCLAKMKLLLAGYPLGGSLPALRRHAIAINTPRSAETTDTVTNSEAGRPHAAGTKFVQPAARNGPPGQPAMREPEDKSRVENRGGRRVVVTEGKRVPPPPSNHPLSTGVPSPLIMRTGTPLRMVTGPNGKLHYSPILRKPA